MVATRLRWLSLSATALLIFAACSSAVGPGGSTAASAPAATTPAGASVAPTTGPSAGADACAGTGTKGGAGLQIPDVEAGKFNVAMVLIGPHDDGGWSQAHYEGDRKSVV